MTNYVIRSAEELSPATISFILKCWNIPSWLDMGARAFREQFKHSEFHILTEEELILCVARINFDFKISIYQSTYRVRELVGLVASEQGKGYGRQLIKRIVENLRQRKIECVAFCNRSTRGFYEKCQLGILYGKANYLVENINGELVRGDDEDIIDITLSKSVLAVFNSLSPGRLGTVSTLF